MSSNQSITSIIGDEPINPLFYCSATELSHRIRNQTITSFFLTDMYINHIKKINQSINCVVNYRFKCAYDEASRCDNIIKAYINRYHQIRKDYDDDYLVPDILDCDIDWISTRSTKLDDIESRVFGASCVINNPDPVFYSIVHPQFLSISEKNLEDFPSLYDFLTSNLPPFFGVPCLTKECYALKGLPHTSGQISRAAIIATYTSPVILNMQSAGFVIMGTTNISELCMWFESNNRVYGCSNNPYNLSRTVGGSSGGSGGAIAALAAPCSITSDVGGSTRMPAFFNGIYGHKGTSFLVSNAGQYPVSKGTTEIFCQAGPSSKYPADLWPMLQVMMQSLTRPVFNTSLDSASRSVDLLVHSTSFPSHSPHPSVLGDFPPPSSPSATRGSSDYSESEIDQSVSIQPLQQSFKPYPHNPMTYGYLNEHAISSLDPAQPTPLTTLTSPHPLHSFSPWEIDLSHVTVYNLLTLGKQSIYCSTVAPALIEQQTAAVDVLMHLGCTIKHVDIDKLAAGTEGAVVVSQYESHDSQTDYLVHSTLSLTEQADLVPIFAPFKDSFALWSSGMDMSDGPGFRTLLLQPRLDGILDDERTRLDVLGHGSVRVVGCVDGVMRTVEDAQLFIDNLFCLMNKTPQKHTQFDKVDASHVDSHSLWGQLSIWIFYFWFQICMWLNLYLLVPLVLDVTDVVETERQNPSLKPSDNPTKKTLMSSIVRVPDPSGLGNWWNELKVTFFLLTHVLMMPFLNNHYIHDPSSSDLSPSDSDLSKYPITRPAPQANSPFTLPAILLAVVEKIPQLAHATTKANFARLQAFAIALNQHLASYDEGAIIVCPPHTRQAPPHFSPYFTPFDCTYTSIFNALRMPATSVPLNVVDGLPTGIQVVSARFLDNLTIATALELHTHFGKSNL